MVPYYLLLISLPFHNDPRAGEVLVAAGPLIITPVKLVGILAVAWAWLTRQPATDLHPKVNLLPLLFVPFALIPVLVTVACNLPPDTGAIGQLISVALLFAATRSLVTTYDRMVKVTRVLVIAFAISSLWVYKEHFIEHADRAWGVEGECNYEALMLLLSIPMAFWMAWYEDTYSWRWTGLVCGVLLVGGVMLTQSRAGIIAGGAMAILAAISSKRKVLATALVAAAALIIIAFGPAGISERFRSIQLTGVPRNGDEGSTRVHIELLKAGLYMMERYPFIGIGMGQFKSQAPQYNPTIFSVSNRSYIAHDTFMQIGSERGAPVLILFLAMLGLGVRNLWVGSRSSQPALSALSRSMLIGLFGICVAALSITTELFPYFALIILSQNLREIAHVEKQTSISSAPKLKSTRSFDCGSKAMRRSCGLSGTIPDRA